MSEVLIIEPIDLVYQPGGYGAAFAGVPFLTVDQGTGGANLVSDDPREIWRGADNVNRKSVLIDFGADTNFDAIYVGNTNADATTEWTMITGTAAQGTHVDIQFNLTPMLLATEGVREARSPALYLEPLVARYVRIDFLKPNGAFMEAGNVVIGKAFRPTYGREIGEGRTSLDTGFRGRLEDGSLSTVEGPFIGGFKWVFGDLLDAERKQLMGIIKRRKTTRPIVVVEDADAITAESIRYGTFVDLEQYVRLDPRKNRWALTVEDWTGS